MRMRKLIRKKTSTPRLKKSTGFTGAVGPQAVFLVVIGVVAAVVMMIAGRQPSRPPEDVATAGVPQEKVAAHARAKSAASEDASAGRGLDTTIAGNATPATVPAAEPAAKAPLQKSPVTMTGCLELAHETFRLKDASGTDVPKSRSWKSGFLKKGSASIELVDTANRLQLPNHVGQRVSVTGTLENREMQVRSLKPIAASCNVQVAKL